MLSAILNSTFPSAARSLLCVRALSCCAFSAAVIVQLLVSAIANVATPSATGTIIDESGRTRESIQRKDSISSGVSSVQRR